MANDCCPSCGRKRSQGFPRTRRIVMARFGGSSLEEIAATEGIHVASVKYHLARVGILQKRNYYVSPYRMNYLGLTPDELRAAGCTLRPDGYWAAQAEQQELANASSE